MKNQQIEPDTPKNTGYIMKIVAAVQEAEIWLYDEIGEGWFGGVSAKRFGEDLKALGRVEHITLRLNSPGGDVFDGLAIYNILKQHRARVTVQVDGLAASIASLIAMAGDEIRMAANSFMMIHKAWGMAIGNADDMQAMADTLGKVDGSLLDTYARRTSLATEELEAMLAAETWMTAAEAVEKGFADQVTEELKLAAHFDLDKFKYKHNPLENRTPMRPAAQDQDNGTPTRPALAIFEAVQERINHVRERYHS